MTKLLRVKEIIENQEFGKNQLVDLLNSDFEARNFLYQISSEKKKKHVGNKVYLRGLIEFSNICSKNCFYCGIRSGNKNTERYELSEEEIIESAKFAYENHYGSIVLQSGERNDSIFIEKVDKIIKSIKELSNGKLGITISLGEQNMDVYKRWFESGAHRYLLRIESSNEKLYYKIHPHNIKHDYQQRIQCLEALKEIGFQVGTGVMIGLPFQTLEDLASDLLFIKNFDADMIGMGPYIEHKDTPLYSLRHELLPLEERFNLTMKMIAILRIMMPDINIAATTALQTIDKIGREKAIMIGANIIMPNISPTRHRSSYLLYDNKPCTDEAAEDCTNCTDIRVSLAGSEIAYDEWGDSPHFKSKKREN
jgi:biotin synthase